MGDFKLHLLLSCLACHRRGQEFYTSPEHQKFKLMLKSQEGWMWKFWIGLHITLALFPCDILEEMLWIGLLRVLVHFLVAVTHWYIVNYPRVKFLVYSVTASHIVVIQGYFVTEEDMLIAYDIYNDNIIKKKQLEHQFQSSLQKIITINNKKQTNKNKQKYTGKQSSSHSCNVSTQDKVTSKENLGTLVDVWSTSQFVPWLSCALMTS